jgi:hypothetical protein
MESAGAGTPGSGVEERVQEHAEMLHHLSAAMDHVFQTMDAWERQRVPPAPLQHNRCFHFSPPPHPVPVGFVSHFPGSTMGRPHAAKVSCCSWIYTWRLFTRLPRAMRGCPPSSRASRGKLWSGLTLYGEEMQCWTTARISPAASGPSLTTRQWVERRVNVSST